MPVCGGTVSEHPQYIQRLRNIVTRESTTVTPFLDYIPDMSHIKKQTIQSNAHVNIGLHYTCKVLLKYKRYVCM